MSKTTENLECAFDGESQASLRYLAFAEKADQEGLPGVARLFRAVAKAELFHALSHLRASGLIGETMDNLKAALEEETNEFKKVYPAMIQDAVADKDLDARHSLEYAMSIEMILAKFLKGALDDPHADDGAAYYICPVCGNTVKGKPPAKCPYCGVDGKDFVEVT
jgi:rubrerythrin